MSSIPEYKKFVFALVNLRFFISKKYKQKIPNKNTFLDLTYYWIIFTDFSDFTFRFYKFDFIIMGILLGSHVATIKIWDKRTFECSKTINGKNSLVFCLAIMQNGNIPEIKITQNITRKNKCRIEFIKTYDRETFSQILLPNPLANLSAANKVALMFMPLLLTDLTVKIHVLSAFSLSNRYKRSTLSGSKLPLLIRDEDLKNL
ncbi:hypothetical protein BpHYR1_040776 [Brachionus plicatilis]|uniref:Uncharacterized protein n=1 Tax=Brachionus plicatilis TaxID=10195 RepID=A0A3M7Q2N3_BRAPC|nr:hypothetical protein BpHYR1_040776 [Brachionus plicatilis]